MRGWLGSRIGIRICDVAVKLKWARCGHTRARCDSHLHCESERRFDPPLVGGVAYGTGTRCFNSSNQFCTMMIACRCAFSSGRTDRWK